MRTSFYFWLIPALALSASSAFFGCAKDPLSLGANGTADGGEPGGVGASFSGGKAGGSNSGASSSGGSSNGTAGASAVVCPQSECGPQLGRPTELCEDGSTGGPTGRCLRGSDGTCGWEVLECPAPTGEAGAPNAGGTSSTGGTHPGAGSPSNGGAGGTHPGGGSPSNGGAGGTHPDGCSSCGAQGQICIYQVGGPGPSHFACATQLPCGAAGACACIQGQGTCDMNLAADGYCHCENGLD
jgi:hypothetical protein